MSRMERVCFQMQVDPNRLEEYRRHHAAVRPEMLEALRDTGWTNYSLFLREDGMVIGYVETEDYDAAVAAMDEREANARWQALMSELFVPGESFEAGPVRLTEIFHLEDQLAVREEPTAVTAATKETRSSPASAGVKTREDG